MRHVMGAFLVGVQDVAALVAHPINSFTYWIGWQKFIILNVVPGPIFLFLVRFHFQILVSALLPAFFFFVLLIERLLEPRPSHLTSNDPLAVGMVGVFLQQPSVFFC